MADPDLSRYARVAEFDSSLVENMGILSAMNHYYRWIAELMTPYVGDRVLDLGCGVGNLAQFFSDRPQVLGIDISADDVRQFRERFSEQQNLSAEVIDITTDPGVASLQPGFDSIITMNTVEHIKDDALVMRNAYRVLNDGGHLVVFVPAFMWLYSILDYEVGHYRRYTRADLQGKMEQAGFRIVDAKYVNLPGALGWYLAHVLLRRRVYSPLSFQIYNFLAPLFQRVESLLAPPFGLSVMCVGRKLPGGAGPRDSR